MSAEAKEETVKLFTPTGIEITAPTRSAERLKALGYKTKRSSSSSAASTSAGSSSSASDQS